jgi:hypothetical protein
MVHFSRFTVGAVAVAVVSGCSGPSGPSASTSTDPAAVVTPAPSAPGVVAGPGAGPSVGALSDPEVVSKLRSLAMRRASRAGVSSPATMQAVAASDHQVAENVVSGAIVNDHAPVYVIEMTGGPFMASHHPRAMAAPQGDVLTVTVDAQTLRVTDVGIHSVAPDLTAIDSNTVDLLAP